jgi:hypothetical protein
MSVSALIAELGELGIELGQQDGRIWYRPRSSMTPDLVERMKAHQGALLAMLRPNRPAEESADQLIDGLAHRGCILGLDKDGRLVTDGVPPDPAKAVTDHTAELTRILRIESANMDKAKGSKTEMSAIQGGDLPPDRCLHKDSACWLDAPADDRPGWIRTTCRWCGRFIGYRLGDMTTAQTCTAQRILDK